MKRNLTQYGRPSAKTALRRLLLQDPDLSLDELEQELRQQGHEFTRLTVANLRQSFREHYKFFVGEGVKMPKPIKRTPPSYDDEGDWEWNRRK